MFLAGCGEKPTPPTPAPAPEPAKPAVVVPRTGPYVGQWGRTTTADQEDPDAPVTYLEFRLFLKSDGRGDFSASVDEPKKPKAVTTHAVRWEEEDGQVNIWLDDSEKADASAVIRGEELLVEFFDKRYKTYEYFRTTRRP